MNCRHLANPLAITPGLSLGLVIIVSLPALADSLPKGFAYLRDIAPSIVQDIRYYGRHNFVGRRIDGYNAPECILTRKAANALVRAQKQLLAKKLSLKVYDCYRPMRAVRHFRRWAGVTRDRLTKREFYPRLKKATLFRKGYISKRSPHARGSTVDVAIIALPAKAQPKFDITAPMTPCHHAHGARYADNSLDFGTGYDCFHPRSHTYNPAITGKARINRRLLLNVMKRAGFRNYAKEWWHFTLRREPFRHRYFNFPVGPHSN